MGLGIQHEWLRIESEGHGIVPVFRNTMGSSWTNLPPFQAVTTYRVTHKGCDFSDDLKQPQTSEFKGVLEFTFCILFETLINNIFNEEKVTVLSLLK